MPLWVTSRSVLRGHPRHVYIAVHRCLLQWMDPPPEKMTGFEASESKVSTFYETIAARLNLHLVFRKRTRGACGSPVRKGGDSKTLTPLDKYLQRQQGRLHRHNHIQPSWVSKQNLAWSDGSWLRYRYLITLAFSDSQISGSWVRNPSAEHSKR